MSAFRSLRDFFASARRRRVIRVLAIYAVAGWIVIQVAATVLPNLKMPDWSVTLVIVLVALGLPLAAVVAWAADDDSVAAIGIPAAGEAARGPSVRRAAPRPDTDRAREMAAAPVKPALTPDDDTLRRSIAVLPFVNLSGDPENEYFSDGISEEILNLLTKLQQLRVASRTSSFAFKGKKADIRAVAQRLSVGTVLEGSVRRAGDRVRITAQLIDTATDSHLWSETYDREFKDVFAIQDDIASSIVAALRVTLTPKERRAIQSVATADPQAYDYYLCGRRYFYLWTKRNFHNALRMYRLAVERDPNYALAYAGLADAYTFLYRWSEATSENLEQADRASLRAIELDDESGEAHTSRGIVLFNARRYDEAEREFERAMQLNPTLFDAPHFYGRSSLAQGKYERAAQLFERAFELNPADFVSMGQLCMALRRLGRRQEMPHAYRRMLEAAKKQLAVNPDDIRAVYYSATAYAALGEREKAVEWAERALAADPDEPVLYYNVAVTYTELGNLDRALELLDRAVKLGYGNRAWLEKDSDFDPLRGDPRFQAILARLPG
jgi:adenylate cyclase